MKKDTICAPQSPGKTAGVNAPPQLGICIVEQPPSPASSPADPAPSGASARQTVPEIVPPPAQSSSVVTKVANLLIDRGHDLPLEKPVHWEDGYVQQKVLMSLHAKRPV
jgi:hypothetical protein